VAASKKVDYDRIEPDWRAGILSPRQLAADYTKETGVSVSHTAIINHFRKAGIERDLSAKIQAKADAMVTKAMVTGKVTRETLIDEAQVIEDNAALVATVRLSHRKDISKAKAIAASFMDELEQQAGTENSALLEKLGALMESPDEKGIDRLNEAYKKVISLPGRVKTLKDLGDSLKTLIALEREAYNIPAAGTPQADQDAKPKKRYILDFVDVEPRHDD